MISTTHATNSQAAPLMHSFSDQPLLGDQDFKGHVEIVVHPAFRTALLIS